MSGNPNGRPKGSRNKRTIEVLNLIEQRGDRDPIDFLSDYMNNGKDESLRIQSANILANYKHAKMGTTTPPRYIPESIQLPKATTLEQARQNIVFLSDLKAQGHIDLDFADSLIADNRTIVNSFIAEEELKLKITDRGGGPNPVIHITGGLPPLPGTSVIMDDTALANGPPPNGPALNGHNGHNGHGPVIDHEPAQTVIESAPPQSKDHGDVTESVHPSPGVTGDSPFTDQEPGS